jgi:hydroxymethylpyrimidine/phosphomethylpyrimidine kinase
MLATGEIIRAVADAVREYRIRNVVVDPVMIAASGDALMRHEAAPVMREHLFPLALVVTPNLDEAGFLCQRKIGTLAEMEEAARAIHTMGPQYVLLKGGHLPGGCVVDLLYDGRAFIRREAARVPGEFHGTGCTLSSAIAALLPQRPTVEAAVRDAREYVLGAIRAADELTVGSGHGPLHHFHNVWR